MRAARGAGESLAGADRSAVAGSLAARCARVRSAEGRALAIADVSLARSAGVHRDLRAASDQHGGNATACRAPGVGERDRAATRGHESGAHGAVAAGRLMNLNLVPM